MRLRSAELRRRRALSVPLLGWSKTSACQTGPWAHPLPSQGLYDRLPSRPDVRPKVKARAGVLLRWRALPCQQVSPLPEPSAEASSACPHLPERCPTCAPAARPSPWPFLARCLRSPAHRGGDSAGTRSIGERGFHRFEQTTLAQGGSLRVHLRLQYSPSKKRAEVIVLIS